MIIGWGAVINSFLIFLNVMRSTEGNFVGDHDGLSMILWSKYFIEAQGYTVEHKTLYQDNNRTIPMGINSRE